MDVSAMEFGYGTANSFSPPFKSSKTQKQTSWSTACNALCVGQMFSGVVVCGLSIFYLFSSALYMGLVLAALLFAVGAIGLLGTTLRHRDLLNFHLIGAILGITLSFQFVNLVWRQVDVDCSLAELSIKTGILEDLSRDYAHETVFDSVYKRMNEMEDMLGAMHYGLGRTVDVLKTNKVGGSLDSERHFLKSKLDVIKFHANKIMQDMIDHPDITPEKVAQWTEHERHMVEQKFKTAEVVLSEIQRHEQDNKQNAIHSERYEELLMFITNALRVPSLPGQQWDHDMSEIMQLNQELPYTKNIVKKLTDSLEDLDKISMDHAQLTEANRHKLEAYRNEFVNLLDSERRSRSHDQHTDVLHLMPEHCVKESKAVSYMGFLGVLVAGFQLSTIYSTLCISFRLPMKAD
eukprot:g720.t1